MEVGKKRNEELRGEQERGCKWVGGGTPSSE